MTAAPRLAPAAPEVFCPRALPGHRAEAEASARDGSAAVKLLRMATDKTYPVRVHKNYDGQVTAAANILMTTKADVVARALDQYLPTITPANGQAHLGDFPPLPLGYHKSAARLYLALLDAGGGPVKSQALADLIPMHRGNVDRHLTRLRSDGFVRRTPAGHVIVTQAEKDAATDDHSPIPD